MKGELLYPMKNNKTNFWEEQIRNMVLEFVKEKIELFMQEEIRNFIENELDDHIHNSRNGYYRRSLETRYGKIDELKVPRDRKGLFQTALFEPYQRREFSLEEAIIALYHSGVSTRKIGEFVERILGPKGYSPTTISNITETLRDDINNWLSRELEEDYFAIYLDGMSTKVRLDVVDHETVYIILGITLEGKRDILGFYVGGRESATVWQEILTNLYERGVKRVMLGIFDDLPGLEEAFRKVFPKADVQSCIVHKMRNTLAKVRIYDRDEIAKDFKKVYKAENMEEALSALEFIENKWGKKYKRIIESWKEKTHVLLTFYKYPQPIRKYIYTTNLIERLNKEIRKRLKTMNSLPNIEAVEKVVYLSCKEYIERFRDRTLAGYLESKDQILDMFEKRYGKEKNNMA